MAEKPVSDFNLYLFHCARGLPRILAHLSIFCPSICLSPKPLPEASSCPLCQPRAPRAGEADLCLPVVKINGFIPTLPLGVSPPASSCGLLSQPHGGE